MGTFVTVGPDAHPDRLWAIRGGGTFGIVTSGVFRLHPIDTVVAGPTRWDREFIQTTPNDLNGFFAVLTVRPAPMLPEHLHLKKLCGVVWCDTGPANRADQARSAVRTVN